jgi:hypothetical protein
LAAFYFPPFLFWLALIGFGVGTLATGTRAPRALQAEPQPV